MDKQGYFAHIKQRTLYNSNTQSRIPLFQKETQYFIWIGSYINRFTVHYPIYKKRRRLCAVNVMNDFGVIDLYILIDLEIHEVFYKSK